MLCCEFQARKLVWLSCSNCYRLNWRNLQEIYTPPKLCIYSQVAGYRLLGCFAKFRAFLWKGFPVSIINPLGLIPEAFSSLVQFDVHFTSLCYIYFDTTHRHLLHGLAVQVEGHEWYWKGLELNLDTATNSTTSTLIIWTVTYSCLLAWHVGF